MADLKQVIQLFLSEAEDFKKKIQEDDEDEDQEYMLEIIEETIDELSEISRRCLLEETDAANMFAASKLAKYSCFGDYINTITNNKYKVAYNTRLPTVAKKIICRHCSSEHVIVQDGVFICVKCGSEIMNKATSQLVAKEITDNSKHIMKQLNAITGKIKPPNSITAILPMLKEWLTDPKYINEFLNLGETDDKPLITFDVGENSFPLYQEYKTYTDAFYTLTEKIKQFLALKSNMSNLDEEKILEICTKYIAEFGSVIPDRRSVSSDRRSVLPSPGDTYDSYDIGNYINNLLVTENPIKPKLEKLFNQQIHLKGLPKSTTIPPKFSPPKKFAYQQNYIFIIQSVYHVPSFDILDADQKLIIDLMDQFNLFIKNLKSQKDSKQHNSCLWQLTLSNILSLPYFQCYKEVINILPIKPSNTSVNVKEAFSKFLIQKYDELKQYITTLRKTLPKDHIIYDINENEDVNQAELNSFLNNTGKHYTTDNDSYLRNKLNTQQVDHDWVDEYIANAMSIENKVDYDDDNVDDEVDVDNEVEEEDYGNEDIEYIIEEED
jgi:hypothetical protein